MKVAAGAARHEGDRSREEMEAREPVDLRRSQQSELLSVIIGGEEEATREESDLGGKIINRNY